MVLGSKEAHPIRVFAVLMLLLSMVIPLSVQAEETELGRFTEISTVSLPRGLQLIHLDPLRGTLTVRFEDELSEKRAKSLMKQIEGLSNISGALLREDELVLSLASLDMGMDLVEEAGKPPILLMGRLRSIESPRAHFLASECISTFSWVEAPYFVEAIDDYCRGREIAELPEGLVLSDYEQQLYEVLLVESQSRRESAAEALQSLMTTIEDEDLLISTGIGAALIYATRDEVPEALDLLEETLTLARSLGDEREKLIEVIGVALFERLVRLAIEDEDALRLVYHFERYANWRSTMDRGVLLALAAACLELDIPEFAAEFYLDAIHSSSKDDPKLYAALARAYTMANDTARAREVLGFIAERYPKLDINGVELPTLREARRDLGIEFVRCEPEARETQLVLSVGCPFDGTGQRFASALKDDISKAHLGI